MMRIGWRGVSILVLGSAAACGEARVSSRTAPLVHDSAGVKIVEFPGDLPAVPFLLEPIWEYGHGADDYAFQFVLLGALRNDGSAVVGDMGNQELIVVAASGAEHSLLAGTGQGPAEVRAPRAIERFGRDSIWVEDVGNAKLMLFEGGTLTRTVSTQGDRTLTTGMMPLGTSPDGQLLMSTASYRTDFEQEWLDGHLTRFDPDSGVLDTVGSYPMAHKRPEEGINPFGSEGVVDGAGGGFVHARMDLPSVIWRTSEGEISHIVRWAPTATFPTTELWRRFESSLRGDLVRMNPRLVGDQLQEFLDERIASYEVEPSVPLPLFGQLHGGLDGTVWLGDFSPGSTFPTGYRVLSRDGSHVGRVEFPGPFRILDIRSDVVLGVFTDEFDVQAVAAYRYRLEG